MSEPTITDPDALAVDDLVVEPSLNRIRRNGSLEHVEPRVMAVFRRLIETPGRPVPRSRLLEAGWPEGWTCEEALTKAVSELRRALDDDPRDPAFVETIPKVGYRWIGPVRDAGRSEEDVRREREPRGTIRHGGTRGWLAAAAIGLLLLGSAEWYGHVAGSPEPRVRIRRVVLPVDSIPPLATLDDDRVRRRVETRAPSAPTPSP